MKRTLLYLLLSGLIFSPFAAAQNDPVAFYNQGQEHLAKGEYAEALVFYDKALKLNPTYTDALHQKGIIYTLTGDTPQALHYFGLVLAQDPNYANAYNNRGDLYYRHGQLKEAEADVNSYLKLKPRDARSYVVRGTIRHHLGMVKEALADYDKAIKLDPHSDTAYVTKAIALEYEYGYEKAMPVLDACLRKIPRSEYALKTRSRWHYFEGRYTEALKDVNSLINLGNERQNFYLYDRGLLWQSMGDLKSACQEWEALRSKGEILPQELDMCNVCAAFVTNPEFLTECLVREGYTLLNKGAYDQAYLVFNRAIEKSPEDLLLYAQRGMVAFAQEAYDKALPDIEKSLTQPPPQGALRVRMYAAAQWAYGYIKVVHLHDPVTAKKYYLKAIAADPSDIRFYWSIGALCFDLEEYAEGMLYVDKGLALDPSDVTLHLMQGDAFLLMKDKNAACESFRKAADLGEANAFRRIMEACY